MAVSRTVNYTQGGPLTSSALSYYWYHDKAQELYVKFKNTGTVAGYKNVTPDRVNAMLKSSSVGQYFTKAIKGRYDGIDTAGINFGVGGFNPSPTVGAKVAPVTAPADQYFYVTGTILKPASHNEGIYAKSMDDAAAKFEAKYPGGTVKSVSK